MPNNVWRERLDRRTHDSLTKILLKVMPQKDAYENAQNPLLAQAWVAIAEIARQQEELLLRLGRIESALRERGFAPAQQRRIPSAVIEHLDEY